MWGIFQHQHAPSWVNRHLPGCLPEVDEPEASLAPWLIWCEGNFEKRKEQMEQMQVILLKGTQIFRKR